MPSLLSPPRNHITGEGQTLGGGGGAMGGDTAAVRAARAAAAERRRQASGYMVYAYTWLSFRRKC